MKLLIPALVTIALAGCTTVVPVKQQFPEAPPELLKSCPELVQLAPAETAITDLLRVVVKNYATYYEWSARRDGWQEWHTEQKQIFESKK